MPESPRLGPYRAARIKIFDGRHEVLHKTPMIRMVELDSPMLGAFLAALLAEGVKLARILENEPMDEPRLELWCELSNTKIRDYMFGGVL